MGKDPLVLESLAVMAIYIVVPMLVVLYWGHRWKFLPPGTILHKEGGYVTRKEDGIVTYTLRSPEMFPWWRPLPGFNTVRWNSRRATPAEQAAHQAEEERKRVYSDQISVWMPH